ncbi:hypothetical protein [Sphingomonas sp. Root710]|uniref:hypothetical protein n=1 Tax=Sphingomonas sp. Root710 TaxID=1736594 RepID=UPI001F2A0180|nr:hypothetical protein [Sphingomonas sp. Root710]
MQIALDGLGQDIDDLPIEEVEHVEQEQDAERIAAISRRKRGTIGSSVVCLHVSILSRPD